MNLSDIFGELAGSGGHDAKNILSKLVSDVPEARQNGVDLQSVVGLLQSGGLADKVQSWIGTGSNMPVSADEITRSLGAGKLDQLAGHLGVEKSQVGGLLQQILPQLVDKLTPGGSLPENGLLQTGLSVLKSLL